MKEPLRHFPFAEGLGEVNSRLDRVHTAVSDNFNPRDAALEISQKLRPDESACVVFFCSPRYDLNVLSDALQGHFIGTTLIGCTTAGEISQRGLTENSITAFSLPKSHFAVEAMLLANLAFVGEEQVARTVQDKVLALEKRAIAMAPGQSFAFTLLDGMSIREEIMLGILAEALGGMPLIGGSAGDGLDFGDTYVYCNGEFHSGAAVMLLVNTRCPFRVVSGHHFGPSSDKLVVTRADPENRVVLEINAEPAAPEYCRVMGLSLDELNDSAFARNPLGVRVGENLYVRSIQRVNDDLSLTFFCAIDTGIVLSRLQNVGMIEHFQAMMRDVADSIGETQVVIGCDCIHRVIEAEENGLARALSTTYRKHRVIGFNTYGEQRDGLHLNHSFTGIAIGAPLY
ncbi:MAG: nitric oxide-sensing protein NosP [Pseudomonadota bacterium]